MARAHLVSRASPISRSAAGGSLVVEALFDGLAVFVLVTIGLAFVEMDAGIRSLAIGFSGLMALVLVAALLVAKGRAPSRLFNPLLHRLPPGVEAGCRGTMTQVGEGIAALGNHRRAARLAAESALVWALTGATYLLLARALALPLSPMDALLVLAAAQLAVAVPGAAAGVGTFELATAHVVAMIGAGEAAAAYAVALHALLVIPITLLSLSFLWAGRHATLRQPPTIAEPTAPTPTPLRPRPLRRSLRPVGLTLVHRRRDQTDRAA